MRLLTIAADDASRPAPGSTRLRLCDPVTRTYADDGRLASSAPGGPDAVVDVLELEPDEATALEAAPEPEPMLVVGSFTPLAGADTLGRFLVGGAVLDTNDFDGHRCPSEQTTLGLWRIARLRGGPFWDGVAHLVASWVEDRITAATGAGPVHSVWGEGETHVRFLADAALLLLAAERGVAAARAVDLLDQYGLPFGGGRWYVHDSLELERGSPDLVVNTHAQVLAVLAAAGRSTADAARALGASVELRAPWPSTAAAVGLGVADLVGGRGPARLRGPAGQLEWWGQRRIAREHASHPYVRLPGGYLARDAGTRAAPHYYFGVNLCDLGVLVANGVVLREGVVDRAFHGGIRWARAVGSFDALRRSGVEIAGLEPLVWQQAGRPERATAACDRLRRAGFAPVPGWPGHTDACWPSFQPGTI